MCEVISDAAAEEEEAIGWMFPSNGFLLLRSSIAGDVAHDTKKGSKARAQEGINSSFAFASASASVSASAFAFAYLGTVHGGGHGPGPSPWHGHRQSIGNQYN